jgi:hypothetical protein
VAPALTGYGGSNRRQEGEPTVNALLAALGLYRTVFSRGALLAARNWPVLGSSFVYSAIVLVAYTIAARLGILGGFLLTLVSAACLGSFLYLVEMIVRTSRVTLEDFRRSFGAYLWDVVAVNFVLFISLTLVQTAVAGTPNEQLILLFAYVLVFVFFNVVPELIYLGHYTVGALLAESYRFIGENWIEWFPPNLLLGAALVGITNLTVDGGAAKVLHASVATLFVYFAMVVRGLLFLELSRTNRRGRVFRHRAGS